MGCACCKARRLIREAEGYFELGYILESRLLKMKTVEILRDIIDNGPFMEILKNNPKTEHIWASIIYLEELYENKF